MPKTAPAVRSLITDLKEADLVVSASGDNTIRRGFYGNNCSNARKQAQ